MSKLPLFEVFLDNIEPVVRAALSAEAWRDWYAAMLPGLDEPGQEQLGRWLATQTG